MGAPRRRRRQWQIRHRHLAKIGRPIYRRRSNVDINTAIQRERDAARAEVIRRAKSKGSKS